jgi:NTE family protein
MRNFTADQCWILMKIVWPLLFSFLLTLSSFSQSVRPRIGVTLSGGGAKGLAHIGILKAIDSAGLKVDYITGTSMGAVIGSLYSIGYSADTLEKIARTVDWDLLLSNQSGLRGLFMEEKDEYGKYDIELPWVNNRFKISTGFLEAQELWLKLAELYFPVNNIKDFSQFNIPFKCIATDVGNGDAVVLTKGEITSAIRSSMAIPSVFTAVNYDGRVLVDGGISRNFPVRDVKEMGADFVIGSTVATGLLPSDKVKNVIQLLLQIAFFREAEDSKKEVPLCDIYIPFNLEKYSMGSFGDAEAILKAGIEEGRKLYPRFKQLADSLYAIYGAEANPVRTLPFVPYVHIDSLEVTGLENTTKTFFVNTMNFRLGKTYKATDLTKMVRRAFGTRYYSRIVYSLRYQRDGTCTIVFDLTENPLTFLKAGVHYNRSTGIGVIANITSRNFLISNSRSLATVNIGENFRIRGEHLQYIGRLKTFGITLKAQFEHLDIATFDEYKQSGLYNQNIADLTQRLHYSPSKNVTVGAGHRFEWLEYRPQISSAFEFRGRSNFSTMFVYFKHNTLDRNALSRKGIRIDLEAGRVSRQSTRLDFLINGHPPADPDSLQYDTKPYYRTWLAGEGYLPLSAKLTGFLGLQGGINFNYKRQVMNEFMVGGLTKVYRNQVLFAGLQEGTIYTPAMATIQGGLRTYLFSGAYLTARANVLFNNFVSRSDFFRYEDFYSGYGLTFSYNFALGPLDLSVMYCDQTKRVQSYINLGIPF